MSTNEVSATTKTIQSVLAKADPKNTNKQEWNKLYEEGLTPWNLRQPAPPLRLVIDPTFPLEPDFTEKEAEAINSIRSLKFKRSLVPGCGEGFDVSYLAGRSEKAVGLEISELAVKKCQEIHGQSSPNAEFLLQDFFTFKTTQPFDLCFDYTFFCAIHPELRRSWAEKYSELMGPGGYLIVLVFPLGDYEGGPPYAVSKEAYHELLSKDFECVLEPRTVSCTVSIRKGREQLAIWRRK
jgi:hypothetical protein